MTIVTTTTTPTTAIISCLTHVNEDNFYIFFSDCTVCLFGHDILLSNVIKMSIVSTSSR